MDSNTFEVVYNSTNVAEVHLVPCTTSYEGKANVSGYFTPTIETEGDNLLKTYLLGRKVFTSKAGFEHPDYKAYLATEESQYSDLVLQQIEKTHQWNLDVPAKKTKLQKAVAWSIAQQLLHAQ